MVGTLFTMVGTLFTSFNGRINRATYWFATIVLFVLPYLLVAGTNLAIGAMSGNFWLGLLFVFQLLVLYPITAVTVKRLHDRNWPGHYAAVLLVADILWMVATLFGLTTHLSTLGFLLLLPLFAAGVWFFIELGCSRGTIGDNPYGPDPLAGKDSAAASL